MDRARDYSHTVPLGVAFVGGIEPVRHQNSKSHDCSRSVALNPCPVVERTSRDFRCPAMANSAGLSGAQLPKHRAPVPRLRNRSPGSPQRSLLPQHFIPFCVSAGFRASAFCTSSVFPASPSVLLCSPPNPGWTRTQPYGRIEHSLTREGARWRVMDLSCQGR